MKFWIIVGWVFVPFIMLIFKWKEMSKITRYLAIGWSVILLFNAVINGGSEKETVINPSVPVVSQAEQSISSQPESISSETESIDALLTDVNEKSEGKETIEKVADEPVVEETLAQSNNELFSGYRLIEVDGGDLSGHREANVVVDIGYGEREYWAFTNEYGQLVRVIANEIVLQDDNNEPVLSSGRYYADEAKVPGVESDVLDEGHVIADSLGGVSNAYNITPQDSTLNRHGDQAYMEDTIRKAGGATDFEAIITYPDTKTHIPSSYQYTYTVKGNVIVDKFYNVNPDEVNAALGLTENKPSDSSSSTTKTETTTNDKSTTKNDLSSVDTNGNGKVTIKEAKEAGYSMPITSDHWLYQYMDDRDGDGMVGE